MHEFKQVDPEAMQSPERRWPNRGWYGFDLTTSGNLFRPEQTFAHADRLNRGRNPEDWVGLEVYMTRFAGITPAMTSDRVKSYLHDHPNNKVLRAHSAFSYRGELWSRPFIGEKGNGIKQRVTQVAWIPIFGAATNLRFAAFVEGMRKQGQEVTVNMHTNLIEGFRQDGLLADLKDRLRVPFLAENERKYKSPLVANPEDVYNPEAILEHIVKPYPEIDGLLLGFDHGVKQKIDMLTLLDNHDIRDHVQVIHLANTSQKTDESHHAIQIGDEAILAFLKKLARTPMKHKVRLAFDYDPTSFGLQSPDVQYELLVKTIEWMRRIQEGEDDVQPEILQFNPMPRQKVVFQSAAA